MKYVLSVEEMRKEDKNTILRLNITDLIQTINVARKASEYIVRNYTFKKALILVGAGGNGNDGIQIANILKGLDYKIDIFSLRNDNLDELSDDLKTHVFHNIDYLDYQIIIDCLFGIGLNRNVSEELKELFLKINESNIPVISIDIPSGINANNGLVQGSALKAQTLLGVGALKTGYFLNDGKDYYTNLELIDIGLNFDNLSLRMLEEADYKAFIKKRKSNVNKGTFKRTTIMGGSNELIGALNICYQALASLKLGSGYANLAIPKSLYNLYALHVSEATYTLFDDKAGTIQFDKKHLDEIIASSKVIAIGMGIKTDYEVYRSIEYLLTNFNGILIIDADGLNSLALFGMDILKKKKCRVVLTPHIKEFSRLSSLTVQEINENPVELASLFASKYDVTLVLKSNTTLIVNDDGAIISSIGSSGLAKGGSGDLLSGILAGILASNELFSLELVSLASCVLGRASILALDNQTDITMVATDVIKKIPLVIKELE